MCIGIALEFCQLVFESSGGDASFCGDSKEFVAINKWLSIAFWYNLLCWTMSNQELLDK